MVITFKKTGQPYRDEVSWHGGKEEWIELKDYIKKIPGSKFLPAVKCWSIPKEMQDAIKNTAKSLGYEIHNDDKLEKSEKHRKPGVGQGLGITDKFLDLYPFQQETAKKAAEEKAWLWNFEMGLGKTASVLLALKLRGAKKILVVCPAMARRTWEDEIKKWWKDHPSVQIVRNGDEAKEISESIVIISYGLLQKLGKRTGYSAIIFDEIHYLQNPDAQRSMEARKITEENPLAWKAGLTGTLITNEPGSAYNPLDILYPGRVGTYYDWMFRYSVPEHNGFGYTFKGVSEKYGEELRERLGAMSTRVSKRDVSHLLPPFTTRIYQTENKLKEAARLAEEAIKGGGTQVCLLTYKRATSHALLQMLGIRSWVITGESLPEQRHAIIKRASEIPGSCIIATIDSTKVSIDLSFCSHVIYVDLVYDLSSVIQSLGRFHRLSSKSSVDITLLAGEKDSQARTIKRKIEGLNKIIAAGSAEGQLEETLASFKELELSNDEINEILKEAAANFTGIDLDIEI